MRRALSTALLGVSLLLGGLVPESPAQARPRATAKLQSSINYQISIPDPASRYVEVEVEVASRSAKSRMAIPAWAPGSYLVRDFGRHVYSVDAKNLAGAELPVERIDKQTWEVSNRGQPFTLSYRVFSNELSVRTSYVDDRVALLNGPAMLMYLVGGQARPTTLRVDQIPAGWRVHTSMQRRGGTGPYTAPSYDVLIDSPLLMGEAEVRRFEVAGTKFEYVFLAPMGSNADVDRLAGDAQKLVTVFADIMGGFPFPNYSFLALADPKGGGGLEHLRSTAFILRPYAFSKDEAYTSAAHLAAHEFFHAWNVKRIHDEVLGPFDYTQENYTDLLWFHEGMTETMETRAMMLSGLISRESYLQGIAKNWTNYANRPGSDHTSIAELSRDAWIKSYQPAANHREVSISYYLKGDLIGVLLDLELRRRVAARGREGSVEGLFRRLWAGARVDARTGEKMLALTSKDIIAAASAEAGEPMNDFFARYVFGTERLPLPEALRELGVEVSKQAKGVDPEHSDARPPGWAGIGGRGPEISSIAPDSPAARAGLAHGDEVLYIDDLRVRDVEQLNARIADHRAGERVRIGFARRGRVDRRVLTVEAEPRKTWTIKVGCEAELDEKKRARLQSWLPLASDADPAADCESKGSTEPHSAK